MQEKTTKTITHVCFFEKHRDIAVNVVTHTDIWVVGRGQISKSSATPNNTFRVVVFRRTGYQKCAKSLGTLFLLAFFARTVGPCWLAWTASLHLPLGRVAPAGWARRRPCICCLVSHLVFWLWLSWVVPLHLLLGRLVGT